MNAAVELFGAEYSVYVRICRIVLAEKGIDFTLHPVDIFSDDGPPEDYLDLNPFGRIPTLRLGDFVVYETDAITAYADEAFPGRDLMPQDFEARARARQIMRLADSELYRHLVWQVYVPWTKQAAMPGLQQADAILGELCRLAGTDWMAGDQFSLADAYVYPMLKYVSMVPECARKLENLGKLARWMERMSTRDSVGFSQFPAEQA